MNIKNNKGITLMALVLTVIIILIITSAIIFNTKSQLQMRTIQNLSNDIELLKSKVDEYYLKYGELPKLCNYTDDFTDFKNRDDFEKRIKDNADKQNTKPNEKINENDGDEYIVIDLEKLGGALSLTYGYDNEYKQLKENPIVVNGFEDEVEDEIFVVNTRSHQIYFPHGIFVDHIMYYTFN